MFSWRCFPFVESSPRAYRLKASNAAPSSSTSVGTIPHSRFGEYKHVQPFYHWLFCVERSGGLRAKLTGTKFQVIDANTSESGSRRVRSWRCGPASRSPLGCQKPASVSPKAGVGLPTVSPTSTGCCGASVAICFRSIVRYPRCHNAPILGMCSSMTAGWFTSINGHYRPRPTGGSVIVGRMSGIPHSFRRRLHREPAGAHPRSRPTPA
jgi:hypothetical protein